MTKLTHDLIWPCYTERVPTFAEEDAYYTDQEERESMTPNSTTASGFSPLARHEAARREKDPMPSGRDYADPITFARDYEAWLNRRGETMAPGEKPKLNPEPAGETCEMRRARKYGIDPDNTDHHAHTFHGQGEGENR